MSRQATRGGDPRKVNGELFTLTYGALVAQLLRDYEDDEEVNKQLEKMGYNIGVRLIEDFLARSNQGRCSDFRETADVISKLGFKRYLGINPVISNWSPAGDEFSLLILLLEHDRGQTDSCAIRRIVSSSSQSHMVHPDWIQILRKATPTCVKGKLGFKMYLGITPVISNWSPAGDEFSLLIENNPLIDFVELPDGHNALNYSNILCGVLKGALEMVQMDVDVRFVQDQLKGDNITEIRLKFIKRLEDAVPVGED